MEKSFRCVTQRCESAKLLIDNDNEYVHIGRGLILYVSWAKGASVEDLPRIVKTLLNMRLLPVAAAPSRSQSICEATLEHDPMHVLVVPQAALTSKLQRGKNIQYHGQLTKDDGAEVVYTEFIRLLRDMSADILASLPSSGRLVIQHGTFGNRQALQFESDGPFTHMFDM
ncbi:hypothetical protein, variant 1 [Aphanomyces astaci]|uniref:D-aminoacyl-tRNA deacylase n=1 Tax=Aphanomyces astaci TaxID=112090 RepID=W4H8C2_APHAT|nr:hypothetical protein, variant 1 [Aphanomyces astaci]ETV88142.1 hypothetical protein, variant 1 [Aphanomyces astaci]|eukprot:XP_009823005.1 hypothetical protein, variant 1 [Aphanomyces astaci]